MKKALKFVMVPVLLLLLIVGLVAAYVAYKSRGDEEVMQDIDRHFSSLSRGKHRSRPIRAARPSASKKLDSQNSVGVLEAADDAPREKAAVGASAARKPLSKKRSRAVRVVDRAPYADQITKIAPATYVVSGDLFTKAQKNPNQFVDTARAQLEKKNGKAVGFKIGGIRPGSAAHALGLRSGDIVVAVNGNKLTSRDQVFVALATTQMNTRFRVDVQRNGQPRSFYYSVE